MKTEHEEAIAHARMVAGRTTHLNVDCSPYAHHAEGIEPANRKIGALQVLHDRLEEKLATMRRHRFRLEALSARLGVGSHPRLEPNEVDAPRPPGAIDCLNIIDARIGEQIEDIESALTSLEAL